MNNNFRPYLKYMVVYLTLLRTCVKSCSLRAKKGHRAFKQSTTLAIIWGSCKASSLLGFLNCTEPNTHQTNIKRPNVMNNKFNKNYNRFVFFLYAGFCKDKFHHCYSRTLSPAIFNLNNTTTSKNYICVPYTTYSGSVCD